MTTDEFLHLALTDLREAVRSGIYLPYGACNAIRLYWYELLGGQCEIDRDCYLALPATLHELAKILRRQPISSSRRIGGLSKRTCASHCIESTGSASTASSAWK